MIHQLPKIENATIFEDLLCDLLNSEYKTISFKKFGKQGHKQKGIDIFSVEHDIAIQCKKKDLARKESVIKRELCDDIEKDVEKIISQDLKINITKLIVASTISDHTDIDEICEDIKIKHECKFEILYWGWETIQNRLLNHKDLLKKYYSNFIVKNEENEEEFLKIQTLKNRVKKDFGPWINYSLENRKYNSRMMIRRFDDKNYPNDNSLNEFNTYNWFKAELHRDYHKGLEFIIGIKDIIQLPNKLWRFYDRNKDSNIENIRVFKIARLNYSEIIDYDIRGDEYDACPHIFCKFKHDGLPFEEIYYEDVNRIYNTYMIENKQ